MYECGERMSDVSAVAQTCLAYDGRHDEALLVYSFKDDNDAHDDALQERHGLRLQRSWRRNSVLLSSLKRWRKPGGYRCAEWVGFRRGKLIAGCYGSRTRMKTASARFFFWSASFHEEGGLVGWPRLLILLGSANAACAPAFAFLAKGGYHESLRAGGARNGRALCRHHRARPCKNRKSGAPSV